MAVNPAPPPGSNKPVAADPAAPVSPVQSRLRWMEITTRLFLMAGLAIFAWAAMSVFIRPIARKLIAEPKYSRVPVEVQEPGTNPSPLDFYRDDDDEEDIVPMPRGRGKPEPSPRVEDFHDDEPERQGKNKLMPGTARKDSKLYGQPSEKSVEIGEVNAGESIFVMKESEDWVLVLRGQGAMLGWMRRDNFKKR